VAVDFAEKMVEICRRKYSGFSNVKIELQNVEEFDFPQDSEQPRDKDTQSQKGSEPLISFGRNVGVTMIVIFSLGVRRGILAPIYQ